MTELERVRELCLALPEVTERLSHGAPTWFVRGKKTLVMFHDDHHGWVGVHLDQGLGWDEIAGAIEDAYCEVAPNRLVEQARGRSGE